MKKLLRYAAGAAMLASAVLAPWVVVAQYNPDPRSFNDRAWGMVHELTGKVVLFLSPQGTVQKLGTSRAVVGELDVRELYMHIADVGTAASHYIVVPSTGTIIQAWVTTDVTGGTDTVGTATILTLYSNRVGGDVPFSNAKGAVSNDARVTGFGITIASTDKRGDTQTDDSINQAVHMGDRLAIMTDGGTALSNLVARITLLIRME